MSPEEASFPIRLAQAEHLLAALETLPPDQKISVTHTDLVKRISRVRDTWKKSEVARKDRRAPVKTKSQFKRKPKP
tara:strand:- start:54922 stop:55149 length:228 start_codon:yes stop_codon:yes gene_type:complete